MDELNRLVVQLNINEEVYSPRRQQTIITMSSEHAKQICTWNII